MPYFSLLDKPEVSSSYTCSWEFNLLHEAVHGTLFKNRWLNEAHIHFFDLMGANSYISLSFTIDSVTEAIVRFAAANNLPYRKQTLWESIGNHYKLLKNNAQSTSEFFEETM